MSDLVTVVMPAFNVEAFVEQAVASLHDQTYPAIELVAVDDGSTDRTGEILERLSADWRGQGRRMIVLHQQNAGAAAARNACLAQAAGAFVCMLDADDRMAPTAVERLVAMLDADPHLRLAAPLWRHIDVGGRPTGVISAPSALRHDAAGLVVAGPIHSATAVMVRADAARQAGLFDAEMRGYIDLDWFVRTIAGHGAAAAILPEPLADYRRRPGQITSDWRRMQSNWQCLLAKMAAAGHGLTPDQERRADARNQIYWATLAYKAGDYPATRRLVVGSWRRDPWWTARDRMARIRTLVALASLLPEPLQQALRRLASRRA